MPLQTTQPSKQRNSRLNAGQMVGDAGNVLPTPARGGARPGGEVFEGNTSFALCFRWVS